jgi:hypothetical protein
MDPASTRCYRVRPYFRNVGVVCTVFFIVVGVVSTYSAYVNIDGSFPNPKTAALVFGIVWSVFSLLGVWLLLLYHKYRLCVNELSIRQTGIVRVDEADLSLVDKLEWPRYPNSGSVRLLGEFGVVKIPVGSLRLEDREEVATFLREAIEESKQTGWEAVIDAPEKRRRSRRAMLVLVFVFATHAIVFAVVWAISRQALFFVTAGLNALMTVFLIWLQRRKRS